MSGIRPLDCSKLVKNPKDDNDVTTFIHDVIVNFFLCFFVSLVKLVTGPGFMSISSLVFELWQFSFVRDWPEIWKSAIFSSEFCPIPGDWGKLWIPSLVWISLIECYWMLQNTMVTAFTVFELLRENQLGGKIPPPPSLPPPARLGLNTYRHQCPTKICKSFFNVTKFSHLEDRKAVHWKSHHDTGTTLSKRHLHCKSNLLRWSVTLGNFYTIRNFNYPLRL